MALTEKQKNMLINKGMEKITREERELIKYYELLWYARHKIPTVEEAAKYLKLEQTKINYFLTRRPVIKALDERGIPWAQHSQNELTDKQVATAILMSNFSDIRDNDEKLDSLGVNSNQYNAWLNDPQFRQLMDNLTDSNIRNIRPTAITEFTKLVNKGNWRAIKYYLDTTGVMRPDVPHSEHLIRLIIEIIQKHVKDPTTIVAIAEDIKLASANKTLEIASSTALNSESAEVKEAQRMLGY